MRQPLSSRLRPFLRRDLRARLVTAAAAVFILMGLAWLGISALTKIDSAEAHGLRVELGVEHPWAVCGAPGKPRCNYDDRAQESIDKAFVRERRVRRAILDELSARVAMATGRLDEAEEILGEMETDARTGALQGDTIALRDALSDAIVDLSPAPVADVRLRRERLLGPFDHGSVRVRALEGKAGFVDDWGGPSGVTPMADRVLAQVQAERDRLGELERTLSRLRGRDGSVEIDDAGNDRVDLVTELVPRGNELPADRTRRLEVAGWLSVRAHVDWLASDAALARNDALITNPPSAMVIETMPEVSAQLSRMARYELDELHEAITNPEAELWHGGWYEARAQRRPIHKGAIRYRSPVEDGVRWQMLGAVAFLFAGIMLLVVGPVVTATTTAREREAGTLPVLRMTGLSAGDLALAMAIGPNVFALVSGGALLLIATAILSLTAGPTALAVPLMLLLALSAATHLTAIGLGDALGQRVNAMVVGGLLALGVLGPGLVGAVMVVGDMASTGLMLGPIPAVAGSTAALAGLPFGKLVLGGDLGEAILGYAVVTQALLGGLCLLSWRRRVEQAWAPLFRPLEGALLALTSVGCSALAVLDLSARLNVQTYDTVNLVTAVSTAFLMPVLAWLLVSSLVRPARASALASVSEVRRAFVRFQAIVLVTFAALAGAYTLVLHQTGLASEQSEIMWATLAQGMLVAQTGVATLLWTSRRREGRHRVMVLGGVITVLQLAFAVFVYNLEVQHVAFTQHAGMPFLWGMNASPYWLAIMVVLWAAGLGLVMAALMRERDKPAAERGGTEANDDQGRWLH